MVTTASSLPPTSSAVNIQIIEPKNFANGASDPGTINSGNPGAMQQQGMQNNAYSPQQQQGQSPYAPFGANPQQQLQDAYQSALNARNAAEQARNSYLNLRKKIRL